jgi:hypothetical protein
LLGTDTEATHAANETLAKLEKAVAFTSHFNMGEPLFETSVKVSEDTELIAQTNEILP